ncbi:hypothetical protein LINGRAHAP2_LOCUS25557 [Linum grandiflorum]
MGNCFVASGGVAGARAGAGAIRVITSTGAVLEFTSPITAGCITAEFPGHALFPSHDLFWTPLSLQHHLRSGHSYYLLPLTTAAAPNFPIATVKQSPAPSISASVREGHVRSKSSPCSLYSAAPTPYRMSLSRSYTGDAFSGVSAAAISGSGNCQKESFWKVKLVISPDQLLQILSQEGSTHELVHNVTAVAKCGGGGYSSSSVPASSSYSSSSSSSAAASSVGEMSDEWINSSNNAIRSTA